MEPMFGDVVLVRPTAGMRVQEHAGIYERIMPDEWTQRTWDDWLHRRFMTGEIQIKPLEPTPDFKVVAPKPYTFDKSEQ